MEWIFLLENKGRINGFKVEETFIQGVVESAKKKTSSDYIHDCYFEFLNSGRVTFLGYPLQYSKEDHVAYFINEGVRFNVFLSTGNVKSIEKYCKNKYRYTDKSAYCPETFSLWLQAEGAKNKIGFFDTYSPNGANFLSYYVFTATYLISKKTLIEEILQEKFFNQVGISKESWSFIPSIKG